MPTLRVADDYPQGSSQNCVPDASAKRGLRILTGCDTISRHEKLYRHLQNEARNHVAAAKAAVKQGFTVVAVDRDDDNTIMLRRKKRRIKRVILSLATGLILAGICVAIIYLRYVRRS